MPQAKPVSAKEKLLAEWVAKGVALGSALDEMLNGSSVAVSFAEFAAHDTATLASGKEGMEAALAEDGENAGQSELPPRAQRRDLNRSCHTLLHTAVGSCHTLLSSSLSWSCVCWAPL